ncbi:ribosomal-protein-alanine N-acetyltransferase [bacterium]|nr:ribosomal-protein-alanine N-acetyltransferase [bacterium]
MREPAPALPAGFKARFRGLELEAEPFRPEHLLAVMALEQACFPAPWSEGLLREEAQPRRHAWNLVVRVDGAVRAFLFNWIVVDEMHLLNLAVDPPLQGKGLGGYLLDWLLREAGRAGFAVVSLEVRASNARAIRLYESRGFERLFLRRGYYTDNGEDAVIMLCHLRESPDAP